MGMRKKIYSSYEEINRDLEILNLERKLHYHKVRKSIEELKDDITLPNLAEGFLGISKHDQPSWGKVALRTLVPIAVRTVFNFFKK